MEKALMNTTKKVEENPDTIVPASADLVGDTLGPLASTHTSVSLTQDTRIQNILEVRLQEVVPYMSHWSAAMALGLLPENLPTTAR
jgi:hypothetical protein